MREKRKRYVEKEIIKREKESNCDELRNQSVPDKVTSTNNDVM